MTVSPWASHTGRHPQQVFHRDLRFAYGCHPAAPRGHVVADSRTRFRFSSLFSEAGVGGSPAGRDRVDGGVLPQLQHREAALGLEDLRAALASAAEPSPPQPCSLILLDLRAALASAAELPPR
jgi:hypothetical protein